MQKDSRILYKWWDAINFDMRMKTWGGKESKDKKGWGNWERGLERADRCRSAGRRRLWWGVKYLSVWERRSIVNRGGLLWDLREFQTCTTMHQHHRSHGTPLQNHNGNALWGSTRLQTQTRGWTNSSLDYMETFLLKQEERHWTRPMRCALSISHRMAKC